MRSAARALLEERSFGALALCTGLCFAFLLARGYITSGRLGYAFLVKNLFLAWVPYCLSLGAFHVHATPVDRRRRWTIAALWLAWLAMFPNAPYIFTDLIHWRHG